MSRGTPEPSCCADPCRDLYADFSPTLRRSVWAAWCDGRGADPGLWLIGGMKLPAFWALDIPDCRVPSDPGYLCCRACDGCGSDRRDPEEPVCGACGGSGEPERCEP